MKKLLLSSVFLLGLAVGAQAQCVAVGGVNNVPQPGMACLNEPTMASYMAAGYGIVPVASATDVACLTGSATKTVRLKSARISGTTGTLVTLPVLLNKHTVANTGGTAATSTALPVPVPLDSAFAAATATTTAYTANPTVDATATILDVQTVAFTTTSALATQAGGYFNYTGSNFAAAPTLRGVAQQICLNLGGISIASGLLAVSFYWNEL